MPNTRLKHGEAGATRKERYDACTSDDLKLKLGSQVADDATWCMVNYKQPGNEDYDFDHNGDTILSKSYMECDCTNPIYTRLDRPTCGTIEQQELFPDYNDLCPGTGTLIEVTKIECRFGHQYVLAEILPAGEAGGGNGTDGATNHAYFAKTYAAGIKAKEREAGIDACGTVAGFASGVGSGTYFGVGAIPCSRARRRYQRRRGIGARAQRQRR